MRVQPEYVIACDYSFLQQDGKFGAIGIFDQINLKPLGMPQPLLPIYVLARFQVLEGEQIPDAPTAELIHAESGLRVGPLATLPMMSVNAGEPLSLGVKFGIVEVSEPGDYLIRITYQNEVMFEGFVFRAVRS